MNNNIISHSILGITLASSIFFSTANAVEFDDFYTGISVVQTYVDERGFDEDTTGGKIFGGYKINQFFSIEASYYDFDEIESQQSALEIDGVSLSVIASLPATDHLSIFAKAGAHDWDTQARGNITSLLSRDSDTDAFYGIGVKYELTDSLSLQAEAERYEVEEIDLDVASIGFAFNF